MGIINDLGINESMTKEQISEQLFNVRKKLITRQNSADIQKRSQAELQLDIVSSMQNAIDKMNASFDVQVLVATYGFAADNDKLNKDLKDAIENAASGNGDSAGRIADFVGNNGQNQLRDKWMFWAADCGAVNAYQVCGYLLTDTDPDKAIFWFEKANEANVISASNIYNWGLIFYRKKEYAKAKEKFERASAEGHAMAPYFIAEMYENGYGVAKDLRKALEQYQLAKQRGLQDAQQGITRVATALNQQNAANTGSQNNSNTTSTTRTQQTGNAHNGQPTLVYKSDRKSAIPNIEDINIDNLKDKVKVDEIAGKVGGFANNVVEKVEDISGGKVDKEKIKQLPWKKILIGLVVLWVIIALLKSCAAAVSSGGKKTQSNASSAQVVEEVKNDEEEIAEEDIKEEVLVDDTDATPISSFEYDVHDDYVSIKSFVGSETEVVIPSVIEGKHVTEIGYDAFEGNLALTSVTIKEGVTSIGSEAFRGCSYLTSVNMADSVEIIGSSAFKDCTSLSTITLPSHLVKVGDSAFKGDAYISELIFTSGTNSIDIEGSAFNGCKSLIKVELPENVASIGYAAFYECESLQELIVNGSNIEIGSEAFENCKSLQTVSLKSVSTIGSEAFRNCISLMELMLPEGLSVIGSSAFKDCSNLSAVNIPSSVSVVGDSAFKNDQLLQSVVIAAGTQDSRIEGSAFNGCSSLQIIDIPGNYTEIGYAAFYNCSSLASMNWGEAKVAYANQSIGSEAFENCSSLSSVTLTKNVQSIGSEAFRGCVSLQTIDIPDGATEIGSSAFKDCTALTNATIPSTISYIGDSCFKNDNALANVSIAEGKLDSKIEGSAFNGCSSLTQITVPKNYVSIGYAAFYNCTSLEKFVWEASGAVFENQSLGSEALENCTSLTEAHISKNVGDIGRDCFRKCPSVTIYTANGSKAEQYASDNNIACITE